MGITPARATQYRPIDMLYNYIIIDDIVFLSN